MTSPLPTLEINHSADQLIEAYYLQSEAIIKKAKSADRLLTLIETRKLKELAIAIKGIEATVNAGATMAIFVRLAYYIDKTDHEFAVQLVSFLERYVQDVLKVPIHTGTV